MNIFMIVVGMTMLIAGVISHCKDEKPEETLSSTVIVSEKSFISSFGVTKMINYEDGSSRQEVWRIITPAPSISGHGLMLNDPDPRLEMVQAFYNMGSDK